MTFPSYCLVLDYLFINHVLHFLSFSFHFAHVNVLLCLAITLIKFYRRASLSKAALTITLPFTPNTCLNPAVWQYTTDTLHHPHSSLCELCIGTTGFLLDSWTLRMGPVGYPKMLIRNYRFSRIFCGKPIGWRDELNFWVQWRDRFYPFYCCTV